MRYESLPRKVSNWVQSIFKYMKAEFGNWAYVILGGMAALVYKPVVRFLNIYAEAVTYAFLIFVVLGILYLFFRKVIR